MLCLLVALWAPGLGAREHQGISDSELVELAGRAMKEYQVPGMAIGVIKSDKVLIRRGFGIREMGKPQKIDPETLFKIASNSKAFTTAALAILVDEERVSWQDPVIEHIPEFRMNEPWVTANFNVTDLLTHRSGMKRFVGDLMLWPEPNNFTRADIIGALQNFELVSGFRTEYAYDNQLYIVAGEIIPRVSGVPWGEFVEKRIMQPAGMKRCFADAIPKRHMRNLATPHGVIDGQLSIIERGRIPRQPPMSAAAGGIICSLGDMLTWVSTQLNHGISPDGRVLFSEMQSKEMWTPRTLQTVRDRDFELHKTHFKAYGLGWRLADVHGYKEVSHTGTLAGFRSYVVLIPELELGVVFLSNGASSTARAAVMNTIVRSFMPVEQRDWIQLYKDEAEARDEQLRLSTIVEEPAVEAPQECCDPDLSSFTGRYRDPWFGDVNIYLDDGRLMFAAEKSPKLTGPMQHHYGNRFKILWPDRTLKADAWVTFERDARGAVIAMTMLQVSEDDNYDFTDLEFSRVD